MDSDINAVDIEGTLAKNSIIRIDLVRKHDKRNAVIALGLLGGVAVLAGVIMATTKPAQASGYLLGDVNGDGVVDLTDLLIATRMSMGQNDPVTNQPYPADWVARACVTGDSSVSEADLEAIEYIILGEG